MQLFTTSMNKEARRRCPNMQYRRMEAGYRALTDTAQQRVPTSKTKVATNPSLLDARVLPVLLTRIWPPENGLRSRDTRRLACLLVRRLVWLSGDLGTSSGRQSNGGRVLENVSWPTRLLLARCE